MSDVLEMKQRNQIFNMRKRTELYRYFNRKQKIFETDIGGLDLSTGCRFELLTGEF